MLGMKNHFDISGSIEIREVDIAGVACRFKYGMSLLAFSACLDELLISETAPVDFVMILDLNFLVLLSIWPVYVLRLVLTFVSGHS